MKRYIKADIVETPMDRRTLAQDPNTSPRTLARLAKEWDPTLRILISKNPNTPTEVLESMMYDNQPWESGEGAAANPALPADVISKWSTSRKHWIRRGIASNPSTPGDILKRYSRSKDTEIAMQVIRNPNTPIEVLWEFWNNKRKYPIVLVEDALVFLNRRGAIADEEYNQLFTEFFKIRYPNI